MSAIKKLIVVTGPTAVGKTSLCVRLAKSFECEIISADSRQFFKEMSIGTAKPGKEEMGGIPHHFIDFLNVEQEISAGEYEARTLNKIEELFQRRDVAILTGGSGLYIKAVCEGMSEMPGPPKELRDGLMEELERQGLAKLLEELREKDRVYYEQVDRHNHQRVVRALEMIRFTGVPFSQFRTGDKSVRDFQIIKIGLEMEREALYERINARVDQMLAAGLLDEVKGLYAKRHLNALQTVGYKEFFSFLEGEYDYVEAVRLVKRNTRRYAKRQMTWFKKDKEIKWFHPDKEEEILSYIRAS